MVSKFLREQKRYTQQELCGILECTEEKAVPLIRKLKEFGVIKAVRASNVQKDMSELLEEDIEVAEVEAGEDEYLYVVTFVGIIVAAGRVLKCYPKYLLRADKPKEALCQVIKVLEKYNSKEQIIHMFNDSSERRSFNLLAVLLFLMQDYFENGVYSNTEEVIEKNGSGEILWDRTLHESFALLSGNRPYYLELQTKKRMNDDSDYFKRLHECILTKASRELQEADLLDIFELTEAELSDEDIDTFGEKEYILYRIEKELNMQFHTRKQLVLKTLYAYIANLGSLYDTDCLSVFGTNSFHLVWESVCADIMDNQLQRRLGSLKLPVPLKPQYDKDKKLIELIERPLWTAAGRTAKDTLIPDLVTIADSGQGYLFVIFDAKYYLARLESGAVPKGQPGIESVAKQYLYQLAYQQFIVDHGFVAVKNCFLMPSEGKEIVDKGEVSLDMLGRLGLQSIKVRLLPASLAYRLYLSGKKLEIKELSL